MSSLFGRLWIMIFVMTLSLYGTQNTTNEALTNFRADNNDIFTKEELEFLQNHPILRVGNEPDYAPWDFIKNGKPAGYSIEYVQLLASKLGIKIEFVQDSWAGLTKKLQNKQIDILHTMYKNSERKGVLYTDKYKNVMNAIFVHSDNSIIKNSNDLAFKTISIPKDDSLSLILKKNFPNTKIIEPDGYIESLKNVAFKKVDATILDMAVANYLEHEFSIPNLKIVDQIELSNKDVEYSYRMGVRDDYPLLVSILNKMIPLLSTKELRELDDRWLLLNDEQNHQKRLKLTQQEEEWLNKKEKIKFSVDPNWLPIEGINKKNGQYEGIISEYLEKITQMSGIEFELVPTTKWTESLELMENKQISMLAAVSVTPQREKIFNFSHTTMELTDGVIMRNDASPINSMTDLKGLKIGISKGTALEKMIRDKYPELILVPISGVKESLEQLASKNIDAYVGNLEVASLLIFQESFFNFKIVFRLNEKRALKMALRKDYPIEALQIINKALENMSLEERESIKERWMLLKVEDKIDYTLIWKILAGVIVIIVLFAFYNRKLNLLVAEKTKELKSLLETFDAHIIASNTDLKGKITYVSDAFCEISGYSRAEMMGKPHSISRHPDMPKEAFKDLWQTIKSGKTWHGELKNIKKDGSFYWVDAIVSPLYNSKQEIIGYNSIRHDITAKKEVEALSANQAIQMAEIERSNRLLNGREMKMVELKNKINEYRVQLGQEAIYSVGNTIDAIEEQEVSVNDDEKEEDLLNLLDGKELQLLMENFYKIMKIPLAIIDLKGNILVQSKWQRACTEFHRVNTESCKRCIESDIDMASKLDGGQKFTSYKCSNGLIDCGSPIIINGKYVANFFIGQFLVNEPDMEYFRNQAKLFGYNEEEYLESIKELPVVKEDMLPNILGFLTGITNIVTSISMERIEAQKYNKIAKNREIQMKKGQIAALNLAEDAEKARVEIENYKKHLESLVEERTSQLKQNQEQMVFVSEYANLGFWTFNPQVGDLLVNDTFVKMLGYDANEVLMAGYEKEMFKPFKEGLAFWEQLLHPDDAQRTGEIITAHINGETELYKVEYRMRKADGSWMWSMAVGRIALRDEEGKAIKFNGVNLDIQDAKDAQELITQNKLFLDTLLDSQEQIVITTDGKTLRSANKMFLDFFILENIDEFKKDYACICDRFVKDETGTYLQKYMGEISWIEYVLANSNKTHKAVIVKEGREHIFSVSAAIMPIEDGTIKSAVFTDITELELQKKQTDTILSSVLLPMLITSKETRKIVYANSFAEEQYETTLDELIGLDIEVFYTYENQRDEILMELTKNGSLQNFETKFKTLKGREFDAILSLVDITFGGKECYLGVASDITKQKELQKELESVHRHTRESIEYASLIQHALIPSNDLFRKYFSDYLTIWHPKDIVGGDIYLFEELRNDDECILFVIDCTGHGVPGAFVTMLVKAIERQIVSNIIYNPDEIVSPAKILSIFNRSMKHLLKQEDNESISNAGFDGGILYFNKKDKIIKFAGAETPLFYLEDGKLKTIKGSRHSVGYKKSDGNFEFVEHIIQMKEGMQLFLSTDGYLDQNGGERGFPLGKKRFGQILEENAALPFADMQEILLYTMQKYQGNEEKNDDVTIVGIKI